jgi:magnesium-transporting ATPase (P-type)
MKFSSKLQKVGGAVVDESMLTGEPMPIQKFPVEQDCTRLDPHGADLKHFCFAGTSVMQSSCDRDDAQRHSVAAGAFSDPLYGGEALARVTATGGLTAKGQLVRLVLFPSPIRFAFDTELIKLYKVMLLFCSVLFIYFVITLDKSIEVKFFSGLSLLGEAINPNIPVMLVSAQSKCADWLKRDSKVNCLTPPRIPIAAKLTCFVFDKTGTITKGGMDFKKVVPVEDGKFKKGIDISEENNHWWKDMPADLHTVIGTCHTVTTLARDGSLVGNMVECGMVRASGWTLPPSGSGSSGIAYPPKEQECFGCCGMKVIRQLVFCHHRMTSGVIVQNVNGGPYQVILKGSFEKIKSATKDSLPVDYDDVTDKLASQQYYMLAFGTRELSRNLSIEEVIAMSRDDLEDGLKLRGLLLFRNEVKPDSAEALTELREADIRCIMCTGDCLSTGVAVARSTNLLPSEEDERDVLVATGDVDKNTGEIVWLNDSTKEKVDITGRGGVSAKHTELCITAKAFQKLQEDGKASELMPMIRVLARMKPGDKVATIELLQQLG